MQKNEKIFIDEHGESVCSEHGGQYLSYVLTQKPGWSRSDVSYSWRRITDENGDTVDIIDTPRSQWMRSSATDWPAECEYCD